MKMTILKSRLLAVIGIAFIMLTQPGCTKDTDKPTEYPIQGLWEGTYTVGPGNPVPTGTSFYFSFSIYPGGKVSYKGKGYYNGSLEYVVFADGTWTMVGNEWRFSVTTINAPTGSPNQLQEGKATYSSTAGTLTNGSFTTGGSVWTMTKVK